MQTIPVDVGRLGALMCVVPPEPRVNKETGEVRKDRDGNTIYVVGISVRQRDNRRADVIEVAVPSEPRGIAEGTRVHVADLVAVAWEIDGRKGTSFRASAVTPDGVSAVGGVAPARAKSPGGEG
ncbi:hypothetical protein OG548_23320 [Streptomyces sp. NBC_01356]|uniref:SCO3933 family regulatory protein n=1 Tax=Streptomyces sp. NBC_01356 TaxID=2903836 RepID=UPI002E2FB98E|nr:hypothetical protein [Streptomyces sp. NBC_01356]